MLCTPMASATEPPCKVSPQCHTPLPPTNLQPPTISGGLEPGQTLTALPGSWTNEPTAYRYQWQLCSPAWESCAGITGANTDTYTLSLSDVGSRITVSVGASNAGGTSGSVSSEATAIVVLNAAMFAVAHITPLGLPPSKPVPVDLRLGFTSKALHSSETPDLSQISLEISRSVTFQTAGLQSCPLAKLYSSAAHARRACAKSLVGDGTVISEVKLPGQAVAPINGHLLAFYNFESGASRILAQVTSETALPLTYVIPFEIAETRGAFGTDLIARKMRDIKGICRKFSKYYSCFEQPYAFKGIYGQISKFEISLHRQLIHTGKAESFVSAQCAVHGHLRRASFPLMKVSLDYQDAPSLSEIVAGRCEAPKGSGLRPPSS
jgi:hypothetical protein